MIAYGCSNIAFTHVPGVGLLGAWEEVSVAVLKYIQISLFTQERIN